jgi:L-2-hydroxyglutarate oxidase LhgO
MDKIKITIIGAGVVGLAIAVELSQKYDDIFVLEKHEKFGQETSSRHSEVIHSGIYYPPNSLKAGLCVEGARLLYEYCEKHSIPHSRLGKLIAASDESEIADLQELYENGIQNGVKGLTLIGKDEINKMEPNVNAVAAIYSPNTGIIDSHSLMLHLHGVANSSGVMFSFNTEVDSIEKQKKGYVIGTRESKRESLGDMTLRRSGENRTSALFIKSGSCTRNDIKNNGYKFASSVVINSAGLSADRIAAMAGIDIDKAGYRLSHCKGSYFSYAKKPPIRMLVYPVPHKDLSGLGIHATLDLGGRLRFGPDTEYVDAIDYEVDVGKRDIFYESAKKYIKGLDKEALNPDMAGIRPKIKGDGIKDFVINHEIDREMAGFINLIGIESPGLTSSLSIAKYVKNMVGGEIRNLTS